MSRIDQIEKQIAKFRTRLQNHELYHHLSEVEDIKIFMEKHVYAVWDFMSLLKALQQELTCVSIPWKPAPNAKIARFINEIVWGEESDVNEKGIPKSHFEMYLEAMTEVGASQEKILALLHATNSIDDIAATLQQAGLKEAERDFLDFTFQVIKTNAPHKIAAAFTFGREDLIPDMFIEIINKSKNNSDDKFPKLTYYLNRHIEVDGDEHGPLALEMITELCGEEESKWTDVLNISVAALEKRISLWDEITEEIKQRKANLHHEMV